MSERLASLLRRIADRIDYDGSPKIMHWSFTFEEGDGIRFREDGRGCPLAYLGSNAYERAHAEADLAHGSQTVMPSGMSASQSPAAT